MSFGIIPSVPCTPQGDTSIFLPDSYLLMLSFWNYFDDINNCAVLASLCSVDSAVLSRQVQFITVQ